MLPHDAQGFLIGEVVPEIRRAAELLERIRTDIADIKRSFLASAQGDSGSLSPFLPPLNSETVGPGSSQMAQGTGGSPSPILPPLNGETVGPGSGRQAQGDSGSPAPILPPLNGETVGPGRRRHSRAGSRDSEEHNRDDRGRFTNNNENPDEEERKKKEEERKQKRLFDGVADRIADAVSSSANGLEDIDPTIKAINEVAEPLARGYRFFSGFRDNDKEEKKKKKTETNDAQQQENRKWYRRLFGELRMFRREQSVFNRAEQRILREINENTENPPGGGQRSSGVGGGILGALAAMFGLRAGSGIGGGIGRIMSGIGSGLARGGRGALSLGGRFLKRIPVLGALLTSLGAAADIYGSETDESLTRREKDRRAGTAIGGASGTIGGAMAGAAMGSFLGPVGTVVGGVVGAFLGDQAGQIIGEKIGEWTNSLRDYDLPGKVMALWSHLTDSFQVGWEDIKKKWGNFVDKAVDGWGQFTSLFESAYEGMKKLPVIGPAIQAAEDMAKAAKKAVTDLVEKGIEEAKKLPEKTKETLNQGVEWAKKNTTVGKASKKINARWQEAKQHLGEAAVKAGIDPGILAKITNFESEFNSEARPIRGGKALSSAHGYGQFLDATWTEMVNKYGAKYGVENAGNLSKSEAGKLRSDKALQASLLAEFTRENIEKGRALGGSNDDANVYALHNLGAGDGPKFLKALKQNQNARVSDILSQKVIAGNQSLYGNGNISLERAYQNMATAMRRGETFAKEIRMPTVETAQVQSVSAPSPSLPAMPKPPVIAEAPKVMMPLTGESRKSISINIDRDDIGQDISDRRLAHIVTGGLSS
jgi:hypothetical protein